MRFTIILLLALVVSAAAHGQSSKKKKKATVQQRSSNMHEPYYQPNISPKKSTKHRDAGGPTYDSQQEFYARVTEVQKKREKTEKLMEKPQYSDPMYFGHKHRPKKRAPSKMKFCKVCGIRH